MRILVLRRDEAPENPRDWNNLGTMICWHRRYNLGDKHDFASPNDFEKWAKRQDMALLLPLYIYDHSAIGLSLKPFQDPWDAGQVGWVYVTREKLRKEYNVSRVTKAILARAEKALAAEIKTYESFLNGEVYRYELWNYVTHGSQKRRIELIDFSGGFYGPDPKENGLLDYLPEIFRPHLGDLGPDNILVEKDGQIILWPKKDLRKILENEAPNEWINFHELMAAL